MQNILDIYKKYNIPESLQLHQLRVASIVEIIAKLYTKRQLDIQSMVNFALLHDMGNIIKFDFTKVPEFFKKEGIEYWENIKNDFVSRYGNDEVGATKKILKEIGYHSILAEDTLGLIDISALKLSDDKIESNIIKYADMRVGLYGVLSLHDRLFSDWVSRNPEKKTVASRLFEIFSVFESELFSQIGIKPEDITDEMLAPVIEDLKMVKI